MSPEDMQAKVQHMIDAADAMQSRSVKVGLPKGEATSATYKSGATVLEVGANHEYGFGVPQRSFLRVPFQNRQAEIGSTIESQWGAVTEGKNPDDALGIIGAKARNISVEAFDTGGYGKWPDIAQETKDAKDSSQILVDNAILKGSITWVVE